MTGDKEWLRECYADLRTEYTFWMTRRITETGLNRYGSEAPADDCLQFARDFDRVPYEKTATAEYTARGFQAECESGWDFSDRFEQRCLEFNPVDLNSNLFLYEKNFAFMEKELAITPDTDWEAVAAARAERINALCWDKEARIYKDYDFLHERPSKTPSAAGFHPYYAGIAPADRVTGIDNLLSLIEAPHGITCTPKSDRLYFQWGYPNGWAPLHYIAVRGMDKYEKKEDAARVAGKYLATVADNFAATGHIWEKYNVVTGDTNVVNEYEMPDMMGWSAGVFVALCDYLAE